jgi:hypothetical protein
VRSDPRIAYRVGKKRDTPVTFLGLFCHACDIRYYGEAVADLIMGMLWTAWHLWVWNCLSTFT